ncbi:MAG: hypothetical protein QNJ78_00905 [Gammaproteobacteria bacterium]|nr:hypothetical protein [Gammaproteobacteria bacterium]
MHSHIVSNRKMLNRLLFPTLTSGALIALSPLAHATNTWLSNWQNIYPDSLSDDNAN